MEQYSVRRGDTLSGIAGRFDVKVNDILAANPRLKANPNLIRLGDVFYIPLRRGEPSPALPAAEAEPLQAGPATAERSGRDWFTVPAGQLTFDAEGLEKPGSKYHSRVPHVPSGSSGVTIGRGYDMKHRSPEGIYSDLTATGISSAVARKFGSCSGFVGRRAKQLLASGSYDSLEITPEAQCRLFLTTYEELAGDVIRICNKEDVIHKYGATDWDGLDPLIRDIVVDLRYRGDYTPATRKRVQPLLVENSLSKLSRLMADEDYWRGTCNVPADRFRRRRNYVSG
jgi:hypothetical protein